MSRFSFSAAFLSRARVSQNSREGSFDRPRTREVPDIKKSPLPPPIDVLGILFRADTKQLNPSIELVRGVFLY